MNLREYNEKMGTLIKRLSEAIKENPRCMCDNGTCPKCLIHKEINETADEYLRSNE